MSLLTSEKQRGAGCAGMAGEDVEVVRLAGVAVREMEVVAGWYVVD